MMDIAPDLVASWLLLLVGVPLLAGGLLILLGHRYRLQTVIMFAVLVAMLLASIYLLVYTSDGSVLAHGTANWIPGVAIPFAVDTFSALILVTASILALTCTWFATAAGLHKEKFFGALVMILMTGVFGAVLTADIFNFFVFIEVMLLPSYGLYALSVNRHSPAKRIDGLRLYISANLLASTTLLAGVAFVYGTTGTVNMGELAGMAQEQPGVVIAAGVIMIAMGTKAAVFPVHTWLTRTYNYTSPAITALFSGLHTKVGVYLIYRVYSVLFDGDSRYLWIGVVAFSLTMFLGVMGAVGETHSRSILVFHMVSQLGYILMGVALFSTLGLTAGIYYLVHNMLVKTSLFLSTGAVEVRYGSRDLGGVTGVAKREPIIAIAFFISALSMAGIPPFSGFVAKATLMVATWEAGRIIALAVMVIVSIITLLSMLKIWGGMFWGDEENDTHPTDGSDPDVVEISDSIFVGTVATEVKADPKTGRRIGFWLAAPTVILAILTTLLGVGAEVLLSLSETAAEGLLDTSTYVEAVLNT